jgi:hypothetical protein
MPSTFRQLHCRWLEATFDHQVNPPDIALSQLPIRCSTSISPLPRQPYPLKAAR